MSRSTADTTGEPTVGGMRRPGRAQGSVPASGVLHGAGSPRNLLATTCAADAAPTSVNAAGRRGAAPPASAQPRGADAGRRSCALPVPPVAPRRRRWRRQAPRPSRSSHAQGTRSTRGRARRGGIPLLAMTSAAADTGQTYQAQLQALNGSGASGTVMIELNGTRRPSPSTSGTGRRRSRRPYPHVQHIHIGAKGVCPGGRRHQR